MIKLKPDPEFDVLAKISVPGVPDPVEIPMRFRYMNPADVLTWFKKNETVNSGDALSEIIVSWTGVMGEDGQAVPYSKEALTTLLKNYASATGEIIRAWRVELQESRIKN